MLCAALCPSAAVTLPLITYQGALLKDVSGNVMHALHLPREIAQSVEEILRKSGLHYNIYADETMYFSTFAPRFLDYARHIGVKPVAVPKVLGDIASLSLAYLPTRSRCPITASNSAAIWQ